MYVTEPSIIPEAKIIIEITTFYSSGYKLIGYGDKNVLFWFFFLLILRISNLQRAERRDSSVRNRLTTDVFHSSCSTSNECV